MQQVGTKAFLADARPVDPRTLPVLARRPSERARIGAVRVWILYRNQILRGVLAIALCALLGLVYHFRHDIALGATATGDVVEAHLAQSGLGVARIQISGQTLTRENDILQALGITPRTSILGFDAAAARERVAALPAVETVTIRKDYPVGLVVEVAEKDPVARWRVDGVTLLVDDEGKQIGTDRGAYGRLPLVIGDGAADNAIVLIRALDRYPELTADVVALSRIADRRWDLLYNTGLRVQLPEHGVAQALQRLEMYQGNYQLLDRDVTIIDLRVPRVVALRPAQRDEEEDD